jgi:hypothetical protein
MGKPSDIDSGSNLFERMHTELVKKGPTIVRQRLDDARDSLSTSIADGCWAEKKLSIVNTMAMHEAIGEPLDASLILTSILSALYNSDATLFKQMAPTISNTFKASTIKDSALDFKSVEGAETSDNTIAALFKLINEQVTNYEEYNSMTDSHDEYAGGNATHFMRPSEKPNTGDNQARDKTGGKTHRKITAESLAQLGVTNSENENVAAETAKDEERNFGGLIIHSGPDDDGPVNYSSENNEEDFIYIDSGCSRTIMNSLQSLKNYAPSTHVVGSAAKTRDMKALGEGIAVLLARTPCGKMVTLETRALYCPEARYNLLSLAGAFENGWTAMLSANTGPDTSSLTSPDGDRVELIYHTARSLWYLPVNYQLRETSPTTASTTTKESPATPTSTSLSVIGKDVKYKNCALESESSTDNTTTTRKINNDGQGPSNQCAWPSKFTYKRIRDYSATARERDRIMAEGFRPRNAERSANAMIQKTLLAQQYRPRQAVPKTLGSCSAKASSTNDMIGSRILKYFVVNGIWKPRRGKCLGRITCFKTGKHTYKIAYDDGSGKVRDMTYDEIAKARKLEEDDNYNSACLANKDQLDAAHRKEPTRAMKEAPHGGVDIKHTYEHYHGVNGTNPTIDT